MDMEGNIIQWMAVFPHWPQLSWTPHSHFTCSTAGTSTDGSVTASGNVFFLADCADEGETMAAKKLLKVHKIYAKLATVIGLHGWSWNWTDLTIYRYLGRLPEPIGEVDERQHCSQAGCRPGPREHVPQQLERPHHGCHGHPKHLCHHDRDRSISQRQRARVVHAMRMPYLVDWERDQSFCIWLGTRYRSSWPGIVPRPCL